MSQKKFTNLNEAFDTFRMSSLSEFMNPAMLAAVMGAFFAGSQTMLVLLEDIERDTTTTP